MAFQLDFQKQVKDPKQKRLLIISVVLFAATGVVFWYVFFPGSTVTYPEAPLSQDAPTPVSTGDSPRSEAGAQTPSRGLSERDIERIKLDTDILASALFRELTVYDADLPVRVLEKGNPNPFQEPTLLLAASPTSSASSPASPEPSPTPLREP